MNTSTTGGEKLKWNRRGPNGRFVSKVQVFLESMMLSAEKWTQSARRAGLKLK